MSVFGNLTPWQQRLQRLQRLQRRLLSNYGGQLDAAHLDAFQAEKRPMEGRTWALTQGEVIQAVAIGLRLLRDLSTVAATRRKGPS